MEDIKEHEVRERGAFERQIIAVAGEVEPRIGKQIGGDGRGQVGLEIADAGTYFNDAAGELLIDEFENAPIKPRIDLLEQRLGLPGAEILPDLELLLRERCQLRNFKPRAAKRTIRSNRQPLLQR